ncbi:MAG: autotransporter assembly complex protein TamA [Gammaproteobacteria bacterium]
MTARIIVCHVFVLLALFAVAVHAEQVSVEISGVNDDLHDDLMKAVTLAHQKDLEHLTLARIKSLYTRAGNEIRKALQAHGYYQPQIGGKLTEEGGEKGKTRWRAVFHIDPGQRTLITGISVELTGSGRDDEAMRAAVDAFPLKTGDPLNQARYEQGKTHIENVAAVRGYFDGAWKRHVIRVNVNDNSASIDLQYDTGPRYRFGEITLPDTVVSRATLKKMLPFKTGDPYDANLLITLTQTLRDSNYFNDVLVTPQMKAMHDQQVPNSLTLTPKPRNSYKIGGGFGTDTGPRLVASWENHYFNRQGHRIETNLRLSPVLSSLTGSYIMPYFHGRDTQLGVSTSLSHEDTSTNRSDTITAGPQYLSKQWGWNRTLGLTYQFERFVVAGSAESTHLLMPSIGYWKSVTDDPVYTHNGYKLSVNLRGAAKWIISGVSFAQVLTQAKVIHSLNDRNRIIARAEFGGTEVSNFRRLPASLRFFAGGDNSVRGFGYEALGPRDSNGKVIGGRYVVTGSLQYEYRFLNKWSFAVFSDAGNAFNHFNDFKPEYSVGFGIHWLSPVGQIRVDLATGISRNHPPLRLHITVGPDL